jgi:hypothetical protein
MIIYTIEIQDGERQYTDWNFERGYNYSDYEEGKITDRDLLSDFYGTEFTDDDREGIVLRGINEQYWDDTRLVSIYSVNSITEADLELIRKYL